MVVCWIIFIVVLFADVLDRSVHEAGVCSEDEMC